MWQIGLKFQCLDRSREAGESRRNLRRGITGGARKICSKRISECVLRQVSVASAVAGWMRCGLMG